MSDKPMSKSRRDAVKMMLGGFAAVPVVNLVGLGSAWAQEDLPHVDPATDPIAQALKYVHEASESDARAENTGKGAPPEEQLCSNCSFVQADSGEWRPCSLFPGKAIHESGWCTSWTLKA